MLRMWRADYPRLAAELAAAARSFSLVERSFGQRIDASLASWELRFETADRGVVARRETAIGRDGWLSGLFRRGRNRATLSAMSQQVSPNHRPTSDVTLARSFALSSSKETDAHIAARVLGPFEVSVSGVRVLRWNSLKARAVFQYLLIHQDRPVRREMLMELVWPDHSYSSARNNLNVALYSLRNTLDLKEPNGQAILYKEGCYLLNPTLTWWIDRNDFLSALHDARLASQAGWMERAVGAWQSAVQLYRGPLLEDDLDGEWYLTEQRQLREQYLQALEYLAETQYDLGELRAAVEFGQLAISTDPCRESAHRLLMRCYAGQHQQQLVSRQFRLCAAALDGELGVAPASETVRLFRTLTSTMRAEL